MPPPATPLPAAAPPAPTPPLVPLCPLAPPAPLVITRGDVRTLEFMAGNVQSEMRLSAPDRLMLAYCRAIMGFALFVPRPRHIVMVGLGGGSLAKFCYRYLPGARISVIELRADVIALRDQFCVPPDDARFAVIEADAALWLRSAPDCADVLIVDGFDESGLPPALASARFYGDCRRSLRDGGVLVANIFSYDPAYPAMLERLRLMFDNRVSWLDRVAGNNRILFALKASATATPDSAFGLRMQHWMARRYGVGAGWINRLLLRMLLLWLTNR